jgi:dihydrolipoamide dehydrogenase
MLIVGSGAVGVEFASIYNSFGTKVTLIEVLPNIVPLEDEEISKELKRVFTKKGIEVHTKAKLDSAKATGNGVEVTFQTEKGEVKKNTFEKMLLATGRDPTRRISGSTRSESHWNVVSSRSMSSCKRVCRAYTPSAM